MLKFPLWIAKALSPKGKEKKHSLYNKHPKAYKWKRNIKHHWNIMGDKHILYTFNECAGRFLNKIVQEKKYIICFFTNNINILRSANFE